MPSRKYHIQLYSDECFPITTVMELKSFGYSIIHAFDRKLLIVISNDSVKNSLLKVTSNRIIKMKEDKIVSERNFLMLQ